MVKRVRGPIIRVQLGHAKQVGNQLLLDSMSKRRVDIVARRLMDSILKVSKLADKVYQPMLMLLQVLLNSPPDSLID